MPSVAQELVKMPEANGATIQRESKLIIYMNFNERDLERQNVAQLTEITDNCLVQNGERL